MFLSALLNSVKTDMSMIIVIISERVHIFTQLILAGSCFESHEEIEAYQGRADPSNSLHFYSFTCPLDGMTGSKAYIFTLFLFFSSSMQFNSSSFSVTRIEFQCTTNMQQ